MLMQLQADITQPFFWLTLGKLVWVDILLSGDNALVIAMVCRGLPPAQRFWGMILGAGAAVAMRIGFTGVVATLMEVPYLKLIGGVALLFVAVKMLAPSSDDETDVKKASGLLAAIGIVMMADAVMSIDNVIAIAAASHGNMFLMAVGLALSIPLIVAGASVIVAMLDRLPLMVWAGGALLGWIAGEVIATDPVIRGDEHLFAAVGAVGVICFAWLWRTFSWQPRAAR